jgi:hypothetical protein
MYVGFTIEIRISELQVSESSTFEVEMDIERRYTLAGNDQHPAELIQSDGRIIHSEIHYCINSVWNKEELPCL